MQKGGEVQRRASGTGQPYYASAGGAPDWNELNYNKELYLLRLW